MANYPKYDLTGKAPAATYNNLVQYNSESSSLVSGTGNDVPTLNVTVDHAVSASWAPQSGGTSSIPITVFPNTADFYQTEDYDVLLSGANTTKGDVAAQFIGIASGNPLGVLAKAEMFADSDGTSSFSAHYVTDGNRVGYLGVSTDVGAYVEVDQAYIGNDRISASQFTGTSSYANAADYASNVFSSDQIDLHSDTSIVATCFDHITLSATGGLFIESTGGKITLTPSSSVEVQGSLTVDNSVSASAFYLLGALHSGALVNDSLGVVSSQAALTTTIHLPAGSSVTTMSFVNGILTSVS